MSDDVLLLDDDLSALGVMSQALLSEGLAVARTQGLDRALAEITAHPPGLVVADLDADGLALLAQLRRDPATAEIPFLLLAKTSWIGRRAEALSLGAQDTLETPLFARDLSALARAWAGRKAGAARIEGVLSRTAGFLVRGLVSGGRSGEIAFDSGARVTFAMGRVVDAAAPPLTGERALVRALATSRGGFRLDLHAVPPSRPLALDRWELTARIFPHLRRVADRLGRHGALEAVLAVDPRALSQRSGEVPIAVLPMVRLFDGRRPVREVFDALGIDDVVGVQAVEKLLSLGVLAPETATRAPSAPPADDAAPKLFEALDAGLARPAPAPAPIDSPEPTARTRSRRIVLGLAILALAIAAVVFSPRPSPLTAEAAARQGKALMIEGYSAYRAGEFDRAARAFVASARIDDTALAELYLGLSRYQMGRASEAVEPLEKARSLGSAGGRADVMLGAIYQQTGRPGLARARYEEYLRIAPNGDHAAGVRAVLSSLPK